MNYDETLKKHIQIYAENEEHWYISKIKQINSKSINQLARGLSLFVKLLGTTPSKDFLKAFHSFAPQKTQEKLFENENTQIAVDKISKLFLTLHIFKNKLVDFSQVSAKNPTKARIFTDLIREFSAGKNYEFFIKKYEEFIAFEVEVHFRNFESWLTKFGFMGRIDEQSEHCFFTPAGLSFAKGESNAEISDAIFHNQIKKLQVWNPSMDEKYKNIKVIPYYLILQLLLKLESNKFSKTEYVLFVTKIKNHQKTEIENCIKLIKLFRSLNATQQKNYIKKINNFDKQKFRDRERTNYERLLDSSSKEIGAYTFGNIVQISDNSIHLVNIELAKKEVRAFEQSTKYIEFSKKKDWIWHFGSLDGLSIQDIVDIYVNEGKNLKDILESLKISEETIADIVKDKLFEKEIEEYYIQNIHKIDPQLKIITLPEYGRQFSTPIGPIDLLCQHKKTKEYYVIEFKRAQVSDDTIGQILRYMGWIYLVMERKKKPVYGIIVGSEFPDKFTYALEGIQSPHIYKLISQFKHPFNEKNLPTKKNN